MLQFNNKVRKQVIINRCVNYLPNPNGSNQSACKVDFVIEPSFAFLPEYPVKVAAEIVYHAYFKIEYNESGGRMWVLDKLDSDPNSFTNC
jgi:hypothetical protein